jgi:hypothetical protein
MRYCALRQEGSVDVTLALLADAANISREGKLNVLGAFSQIIAPEFPYDHPMMTLVLRLDAASEDFEQPRRITIVNFDEDLNEHGQINGEVIAPATSDGTHAVYDETIPVPGALFPRPGRYVWRIMVDGVVKAETPLTLLPR